MRTSALRTVSTSAGRKNGADNNVVSQRRGSCAGPCGIAQSWRDICRSLICMKNRRAMPKRAERVPKPIAPNPWRRGRRRSGVHAGNGAPPAAAAPVTEPRNTPAALGSARQVVGLFADRASAERACRALADRGYREDAIRLLISDDALAGSGISHERVAEYETALRNGAVLLSVITRSPEDARLLEIEWRKSYRAEKVQS